MKIRELFRGRRKWIAAALAVVVLVGVGAAIGGGHHGDRSPEARADWATKVATRKLDLDDAQRDAFRKVADAYVATAATDRTVAQEVVRETRDLVTATTMSAGQIAGLAERVKSELDRRVDAVAPPLVDFHAMLNQDQRAKLARTLDRVLRRLAD